MSASRLLLRPLAALTAASGVAALALALAGAAWASFSAPTLLSGTQSLQLGANTLQFPEPLQFESAEAPAFAADGTYVVFRGSLAGVPGIYRRDLQTGEVALVAGAAPAGYTEPFPAAPDATAPSISADGRYVAFTSAQPLVPICGSTRASEPGEAAAGCEPENDRNCPQVYVRDMGPPGDPTPLDAPDAYMLVSAASGSGEGLTYSPSCPAGSDTQLALAGAQAATGVALSADGLEVAFTVLSASNLDGTCSPPPSVSCSTEPSQVAVRNLQTKTTTLVTATPAGLPTPGGGAYPSAESEQYVRFTGGQPGGSSAAISADGTTVAWEGTNVPEQVPGATDVERGMAGDGGPGFEVEPLWRRITDGASAQTVRLLAGAGLEFYNFGVTKLGEIAGEPVRGGAIAFESQEQDEFIPPAISADGSTVATIANAFTQVNESSYQFLTANLAPPAEAYVVHIGEDPTATPEVTPLTATPDYAVERAIYGGVGDIAIAPDGSHVAFNTRRVSFALQPPNLISPPAPETNYAYTYSVDLSTGIMQRVARGYEDSPPDGAPGLISLAGDDLSIAFASSASNIVYGDGAPGASQIYLTRETPPASELAIESVGSAPQLALPVSEWVLDARAVPQPDGSVLVQVTLPGAGKLQALAEAQLPTAGVHAAGHSAKRHARAHKASVSLQTRTVAKNPTLAVSGAQTLSLRLRAGAAYNDLLDSRTGLYVVLHLGFAAPGHATLVCQIPVTLRDLEAHRKQSGKDTVKRSGSRKRTAKKTLGTRGGKR